MAIDPTTTITVKVGELTEAAFNSTDLIPHEVGGFLKKGTLQDLATFIGSIISVDVAVGFRAVDVADGETLPATDKQEFILVGPGTYPNVGGGATITTTGSLNALVSNGVFWFIGVEIPINVDAIWGNISGVLSDQTDLWNILEAKADLVDGKVPTSQLPSYVDDVIEVNDFASLPIEGETGKIYVTKDNGNIYRWSGTVYIRISDESPIWGIITGTLSDQTDLQDALDGKFDVPTGDTTQYIAGDGSLITFPVAGQAGTLVRLVLNNSGATITKGTVVYINGASGNKPTIAKAIATGDATSAQTFGLVQADIANNSTGYVVVSGDLIGLNTSLISEGTQLYLSSTTAGDYTTIKQYAPSHLVYIGIVTRSHASLGQIEVKIQNGYELDELHDVSITSKSNNEVLVYESSSDLWKNKPLSIVLGGSPITGAGTTNYLSKFTGSGTLGNSLIYDNGTNVGIGTTSSAHRLQINANPSGANNVLGLYNVSSVKMLEVNSSSGNPTFSMYKTDGTTLGIFLNSGSNSYFNTGGNVGIGTTNPQSPLQVGNYTFSGGYAKGTVATFAGAWSSTLPMLTLISTDTTSTQNKGGSIAFGGGSEAGSTPYIFAQIKGLKELAGSTYSGYMAFYTTPSGSDSNTERMRITSSGNVGIGTTSPDNASGYTTLSINGSSGGQFTFKTGSSKKGYIYNTSSSLFVGADTGNNLIFDAGASERMRITSGGNVGIGTTSPRTPLEVFGNGLILSYSTSNAAARDYLIATNYNTFGDFVINQANANGGNPYSAGTTRFTINASGNVGIGTTAPLTTLTVSGNLSLFNTNQLRYYNSAKNNWTQVDSPLLGGDTEVDFRVITKSGTFYINPSGDVFIGSTVAANSEKLGVNFDSTSRLGIVLNDTYTGVGSSNNVLFKRNGSNVGSISTTTTTTSYNTTSDYRLKEDFKNYSGLDLISNIKTYDFKWKNSEDRMYGVIAHELQEVVPYAVNGEKDAEDMQQVDYSKLVPILVNAIKELKAEIEILKNK